MAISIFAKLHRRFGQRPSGIELEAKVARSSAALRDGMPIEASLLSTEGIKRQTKVVVVGGGFAGLCAAYYLTREGANVTLFEAQNRYGGRVRTDPHFAANRLIEEGAELIGLNHPLWLMLAKRFGLALSVVTPELDFKGAGLEMPLHLNGGIANLGTQPSNLDKIYYEMDQVLGDLNDDASKVIAHAPWTAQHVTQMQLQKWDRTSVDQWLIQLRATKRKTLRKDTWTVLRFDLENNQTVGTSDQSYLGLLAAVKGGASSDLASKKEPSEYWTETEIFRCADGNQELARRLLAGAVDNAKRNKTQFTQHTNTRVSAIKLGQPIGKRKVIVSTENNGRQLDFDWVVLAIPPRIYPSITVTGLPKPRVWPTSFAIQTGEAAKYLSLFKERFWIKAGVAPSAADDFLGAFWEGTDNQAAPPNSEFDISLFSGGKCASNLASLVTAGSLQHRIDGLFKGFATAFQGGRHINWHNEKDIRTGYSCPKPRQVLRQGKYLNEVYDGLVFAGEHTSMAFFGYMEGALQSGLRAASQVAGSSLNP